MADKNIGDSMIEQCEKEETALDIRVKKQDRLIPIATRFHLGC